ncbi:unnamed protein product [Dovyalis caffra]|uniref:Uncharacterized protein n=1 Tax=Dovyalis caffra TaxID=77055 RepID=A0AAV1QS25_9ROSI|nr:unnamed protein product [Dovyalis caffra]
MGIGTGAVINSCAIIKALVEDPNMHVTKFGENRVTKAKSPRSSLFSKHACDQIKGEYVVAATNDSCEGNGDYDSNKPVPLYKIEISFDHSTLGNHITMILSAHKIFFWPIGSVSGYELPIFITTDDFTNANILEATYTAIAGIVHANWIDDPTIPIATGFLGKVEFQWVWKDGDGVLTRDPTIYPHTELVPYLTFKDARRACLLWMFTSLAWLCGETGMLSSFGLLV